MLPGSFRAPPSPSHIPSLTNHTVVLTEFFKVIPDVIVTDPSNDDYSATGVACTVNATVNDATDFNAVTDAVNDALSLNTISPQPAQLPSTNSVNIESTPDRPSGPVSPMITESLYLSSRRDNGFGVAGGPHSNPHHRQPDYAYNGNEHSYSND